MKCTTSVSGIAGLPKQCRTTTCSPDHEVVDKKRAENAGDVEVFLIEGGARVRSCTISTSILIIYTYFDETNYFSVINILRVFLDKVELLFKYLVHNEHFIIIDRR